MSASHPAAALWLFVATFVVLVALRKLLPHRVGNYRGIEVLGFGGVALFVVAIAVLFIDLRIGAGLVILGLMGFLDDARGDRSVGGFRGHIRSALRGRITTGFVKLVFGGLVALWFASGEVTGVVAIVLAGLVAALAINSVNLLDLRPGRAVKFWAVTAGAMALAGPTRTDVLAITAGAAAAFLIFDVREKVMLGDTGAGILGGVLAATVVGLEPVPLLLFGLAFAFLNLISEFVSIGSVIRDTPVLRQLDSLGRSHMEPKPDGAGRRWRIRS